MPQPRLEWSPFAGMPRLVESVDAKRGDAPGDGDASGSGFRGAMATTSASMEPVAEDDPAGAQAAPHPGPGTSIELEGHWSVTVVYGTSGEIVEISLKK